MIRPVIRPMKAPKIPARLVALLLAPLLALAAVPARAVDFSGETVEFIIPFKEGGGTDRWARFYAPLLSQHLPGRPKVVVKNVPGGGSTTGANQFAQRAKPDGLMVFGSSSSTLFPFLLGDSRVQYDYADWTVVLASPTGGVMYVSPQLKVKSAKETAQLRQHKLFFGSQGADSLDLIMLLAMDLLQLDVRSVFGMKGRGSGRLAFERSETNIDYQTSPAYLKSVVPLVKDKEAVPLMTWGALNKSGKLSRDPTFPSLPHFTEVYKRGGGDLQSPGFAAWRAFFAAGFPAQKMIFLPKGTPDEIADAYRQAFVDIFASDEYKTTVEKALGKYRQFTGERAEKMKEVATTLDPESRQWVRDWLSRKYGLKF